MKKKITTLSALLLFAATFLSTLAHGQVGVNTTNPQGIFNIDGGKDNPTTGAPGAAAQVNDFVVLASGNTGVGTTVPASKLEVNGSSTNTVAYNAGSTPTVIDFTKSNLAYTSAGGEQAFYTLNGLKSGGTYTLALQGTGAGTPGFKSGDNSTLGFYFANGTNGASTISGFQTVYTFIVMGTYVYYWVTAGVSPTPIVVP